jgi:hypothetical protein
MTEQIKKINNPLTIIAIFAALAEINATIAIGLIDASLHYIFIWFVIGFPTILVILFFVTLNFNTKVMYSPSDYRDDKTFLDSIYGQPDKKIVSSIESVNIVSKSLEDFEKKIFTALDEKIASNTSKTVSGDELKRLIETTLKQTKEDKFEIPQTLRKEIVRWISYPAYLPIVYAIYKENASTTNELKQVEERYNLPQRWDKSGLKGLLGEILVGDENKFSFADEIKGSIFKWINQNEDILKQVVISYSKKAEGEDRHAVNDEARLIAQRLTV